MQLLWDKIFNFFNIVSDNVYFVLLFVSVSTALLMFFIQFAFSKVTKRNYRIIFGPISMCIVYFFGDMTTNLPVLHPRMNLALSTTTGIIQQSNSYMSSFEHFSGLNAKSSQTIAEFLYNMPKSEQTLWKCEPQDLYHSLFETMDQIRGGWFLPNVDTTSLGTLIVGIVISIVLFLTLFIFPKVKKREIVWGVCTLVFAVIMSTVSNGALLGTLCAWSTSTFLFILYNSLHEKEPGSFSESNCS